MKGIKLGFRALLLSHPRKDRFPLHDNQYQGVLRTVVRTPCRLLLPNRSRRNKPKIVNENDVSMPVPIANTAKGSDGGGVMARATEVLVASYCHDEYT